jgi:hypothetical protein
MKSKIFTGLLLLFASVVVASCQAANRSSVADLMFCANQAVFSITLGNDGKTEMRKVVDLPEDATCPVWSPDGKFAVLYRYRQLEPFVQEDSLNLIDRSAGTIKEVYRFGPGDDEWAIRWLPDGVELLLASARDMLKQGNTKCNPAVRSLNELYGVFCWAAYADFYRSKISLHDSIVNFKRLTNSPMLRCELTWSPDGKRLAYTHGAICSEGVGDEGSLSVLDLDTNSTSVLVDAAAYIAEHPGSFDWNLPDGWSPDSQRLVLHSRRDDNTARMSVADSNGIHAIPPEGPTMVGWLPDGKRLLWFNRGFGVTNIESGTVETLPISIAPGLSVGGWVVSPNGQYLAWRETYDEDKAGQVRIYDFAKSTTATVLNITPGALVWSPDSQLLAFPTKTRLKPDSCDHQVDIYVVKPDASGLRNLTEGQQMKALSCAHPGGMGSGSEWYNRFAKDVQWVPHN